MKQLYDITPPPELVWEWTALANEQEDHEVWSFIATQAAQWGADQELQACCAWLPKLPPRSANDLRKHRRPKPPSLKEQALEALGRFSANSHTTAHQMQNDFDLFRRALQSLDD